MQIKLQNIGIIEDSTIALDGLTVITGRNNSGKTTVGKAVYSLIDAVSNIQQKAKIDRKNYIQEYLDRAENTLEIFRMLSYLTEDFAETFFSNYPALKVLFTQHYTQEFPEDIEGFAHDVYADLQAFDDALLDTSDRHAFFKRYVEARMERKDVSLREAFAGQKERAISILRQLFENLEKDLQLINYARESINRTLDVEFSGQIQPVKNADVASHIELTGCDTTFFKLEIKKNRVVNTGNPVFFSSPYKNVFLIDDPYIMDDLATRRTYRRQVADDSTTILNPSRILNHQYRLRSALRGASQISVFEQTVVADSLDSIKKKIDEVMPGSFEFSTGGDYYVQNGTKLRIENLAAGSKMFSIVKLLIEKGMVNSETMLILDEPEAHLHPEWQNAFAEIIVLMVKELGVNVLLTTHGSNFMLAIDAYMRKYGIAGKSNFYQTAVSNNGFVHYRCVNDNIEKIYQDFLLYLSEVKVLRDRCLLGFEE